MESQKINKKIDNYLKFKYNITPIDSNEKLDILNSEVLLLEYYTNEILDKVKENFYQTANDTTENIKTIARQGNLKLGKFYLGCVYRDFYFSLFGIGTSITCTLQEDKNSKTTSEFLISKMNELKNETFKSKNIIEIINLLEKFREEIF